MRQALALVHERLDILDELLPLRRGIGAAASYVLRERVGGAR